MTTVITFDDEDSSEVKIDLTDENLSRLIVDLSIPEEVRLEALQRYYQLEGRDNTIETINRLSTLYEMSGIKTARQFLFSICQKDILEPFLQSIVARSLFAHNNTDTLAFEAIEMVYPKLDNSVGTPYKIDFVKMLMLSEKHQGKARDYFCSIIDNTELDCQYRYKTILSLESESKYNFFLREAQTVFLLNQTNDPQYRILAGQYLLLKYPDHQSKNEFEKNILSLAENAGLEYNLRADAADVILQYGSTESKLAAENVIMNLGYGERKVRTIYSNAQNVHTKEIENSVSDALEFLQKFELLKHKGKPITIDYVEKKVDSILKTSNKEDLKKKVKIAFNRIAMDRALYSRYNCTLEHILLQVWTYLTGHKNEEDIQQRLIEELSEMSGTCSSGFATRLVNTISGFGDFSVKISWSDQIVSNFTGRLNARIRDMDNLALQEKVVEEMTIPSGSYELRKNFLRFFRSNMLSIREEMYDEFKAHISDTDFDLYFRAAISMYENGEI